MQLPDKLCPECDGSGFLPNCIWDLEMGMSYRNGYRKCICVVERELQAVADGREE